MDKVLSAERSAVSGFKSQTASLPQCESSNFAHIQSRNHFHYFMFCSPHISVLFYLMTNLTHNSFLYTFISIIYMFRAYKCSSSGDSFVSKQHLFCSPHISVLFYLMTNLTHNSFLYTFISILYMFRAYKFSSSGDSFVSKQHLVYVTLCR